MLLSTERMYKLKRRNRKKQVKLSKTKPDLKKGISADDVFNWYSLEELRAYIKENAIPVSAGVHRLRPIAQVVADYLNGTLKVTEKTKKTKKRKRASSIPAGRKKRKTDTQTKKADEAESKDISAQTQDKESEDAPKEAPAGKRKKRRSSN